MNSSTIFNIFGKYATNLRELIRIPRSVTIGITNECVNQLGFKLFADYDNVDYSFVVKDIQFLQELGLCSFIVLCNSEETVKNADGELRSVGHYTVCGLDVLPWRICMDMKSLTRCDRTHKIIPYRITTRQTVLRIAATVKGNKIVRPAPQIKDIFYKKNCNWLHCTALYTYLMELFEIPLNKLPLTRFDKCRSKQVEEIFYNTRK